MAHSLLTKYLQTKVGVLCLSECERDPVMFYHYGDRHHGMCPKFGTGDFFADVECVKYGTDYPAVEFFDDENHEAQYEAIFLTKYQGWSYEKEWRIVYTGLDWQQPRACKRIRQNFSKA